jgi:hypothetical protein
MDRTRIRSSYVIHDRRFIYGSKQNPVDILLNHLKLDDNAASATLIAEVGPNATWSNISDGLDRDTNTAGDSVQEIGRGRNLDTQNGLGYIEMAVGAGTVHDNAFFKKGSILISVYPQFNFDDVEIQLFWDMYVDTNNKNRLRFLSEYFQVYYSWGGNNSSIEGDLYTENYSFKRPMMILCSWDSDRNFMMWAIDSQIIGFYINTTAPSSGEPVTFKIACYEDRGNPGDLILDEIKTFSECLLPYGGYFIGNGEGLLADIDKPHKDLCFFWDAQGLPAKGGVDLATDKTGVLGSGNTGGSTSFPTSGGIVGGYFDNEASSSNYYISFPVINHDIFNGAKGTIALWAKIPTVGAWNKLLFFGDGNDYIDLHLNSSSEITFALNLNGADNLSLNSGVSPSSDKWAWYVFRWSVADEYVSIEFNGIKYEATISLDEVWSHSGTGTMYIAAEHATSDCTDIQIGRVFISKNTNTPEIWTAFGKPLHDVEVMKNSIIQQRGGTNGYDVVTAPDGSKIITMDDELVGS